MPHTFPIAEYEIPQTSAKSWALFNSQTGKVIWLKDAHKKREIASLTKIMTCYLSLLLCEELKLNVRELVFRVSYRASSLGGTLAELKFGDKVRKTGIYYGKFSRFLLWRF
jgi:D-alanyl-D-alanine carboxypeptidase (penicillin-binding protein 5/6)